MSILEALLAGYQEQTPTVAYTVGQLDRLVKQQLSEALHPLGIHLPQYVMLSNLYRKGPMSNSQLAERSFITPQSANQIVNTLVECGWVTKCQDPNHGRMVLIELSNEGKQHYLKSCEAATLLEKKMLSHFHLK